MHHFLRDFGHALRALLLAGLCLLIGQSALAANWVARDHYRAELVAESSHPAPGHPVTMAVHIQPKAGWHIYWSNPGQSGYAPALNWALPKGSGMGSVRHPVPTNLVLSGIASNVHEGETILLQDVSLPSSLATGTSLNVAVDVDLLICSESSCVPDPVRLTTRLTSGDGHADAATKALFDKARAALPGKLSSPARYSKDGPLISIFLPGLSLGNETRLHVFAEQYGAIDPAARQSAVEVEGGAVVKVQAGTSPLASPLNAVIRVERPGQPAMGYAITAQSSGTLPEPSKPGLLSILFGTDFLLALGGAVLGGLLLNLMPCVFPILSLKAMSLARSAESDRDAQIEAIGYSIGAIGTIVALGAILLALRSGGNAMGWAFQLQDTRVVALLLLLVTAIATNMAGLYELPALSVSVGDSKGFTGALSTGALAAFIATPCTGPFMAGALGAAMILPVPAALAVFFGLGLGLALPFLALGYIKPMRRWLPRPGNWMVTLRHLLSVPMFVTALGLAWIIGRQGGVTMMASALGAALLLGLGLWWFGMRQHHGKRGLPSFLPMLAAVAMALFVAIPTPGGRLAAEAETGPLHSEPYSPERLAAARTAGKPVFLYLTADWCLSCKVNEATSLSAARVVAAFDRAGVVVLKGDWTRGDPAVGRLLKERGKAGVPVYLWYAPGKDARDMPQVLTPGMLESLVGAGARDHT